MHKPPPPIVYNQSDKLYLCLFFFTFPYKYYQITYLTYSKFNKTIFSYTFYFMFLNLLDTSIKRKHITSTKRRKLSIHKINTLKSNKYYEQKL